MTKDPKSDIILSVFPKQELAWIAWENDAVDDVIYGGAAGGGKSYLAGQVLTGTALKYPGCRQFLGRKELKSLMMTSYITLTQKVFPTYGLRQGIDWRLDGKYNIIHFKNGSTIALLDLAYVPSDPLFDRFGSHEYTKGWIEEASEVHFKAYDVLKSRVGRWMNQEKGIKAKLGLSLNPSQDWPYRLFYSPWKEAGKPVDPRKPLVSMRVFVNGKEHNRTFVFIPALARDNKFTAGEYQKNLATITDPVLRARLMDGDWEFSNTKDTLFDAQTIADIFKNAVAKTDDRYMIVDASRLGGDELVLNCWRGWDAYKIKRFTMKRTPEAVSLIITTADQEGIPRENILIDEDGVGGGILDYVEGALGFHGGASPFGKIGEQKRLENYENLRSQCMYHLALKARERAVVISDPDIETREKAADDLKQMKRRDSDKDGKLKVVKKEDMKAALGRSPDVGDTLMMRSYFDLRLRDPSLGGMGTITVHIPDFDD